MAKMKIDGKELNLIPHDHSGYAESLTFISQNYVSLKGSRRMVVADYVW